MEGRHSVVVGTEGDVRVSDTCEGCYNEINGFNGIDEVILFT